MSALHGVTTAVRALLAALVVLVAAPAPASAATLYVAQGAGNVPGCPQGNPCGLAQAIAQADATSERDAIQVLGALTFAGTADLTNSAIDLVGSGRGGGGTFLDTGGAQALRVGSSSSSQNLAVRSGAAAALTARSGATLRTVSVTGTGASGSLAVEIVADQARDTLLQDVQVLMQDGTNNAGLQGTSPATIRLLDSSVSGPIGVFATGGNWVLQRGTVSGGFSLNGGTLFASSSVLRGRASGVVVNGASATLHQLTVDGAEATAGTARGIAVSGSGASATVRGSIIRDFPTDLAQAGGGALNVGTSSFATTSGAVDGSPGGNVNRDPAYVDRLGGDYRLRAGSSLIDIAGGGAPSGEESPLDRRLAFRVLDGNGDGGAQRDMGAFEYRRPNATLIAPQPQPVEAGRAVTLDASASSYPDGQIVRYDWDLDGNGSFERTTGGDPRVSHTFSAAQRSVRVTVRATGSDGAFDDAGETVAVRDRLPPRFISLSMTYSVFAVHSSRTALTAAAKRGTTFRYVISEPATVRLYIERETPGRRVGRNCLPATFGRRFRPRCTRYVLVGTIRRRNQPANVRTSLFFSGRLNTTRLRPARYRATLDAVDPSGNKSRPRYRSFRVVLR